MLREFKGCIKYALLQIQIRGENPNTRIAEFVSPPEPLKYMKCIVSLCSGYFESIEKHFLQYTLCKSNVGMYSTIGEGGGGLEGFQYVNLTSSRLLSRLRSTSTSGGPFNWSLSPTLEMIYEMK